MAKFWKRLLLRKPYREKEAFPLVTAPGETIRVLEDKSSFRLLYLSVDLSNLEAGDNLLFEEYSYSNGTERRFNSISIRGTQADPLLLFRDMPCPDGYKLNLTQITGKPRKLFVSAHKEKL